MVAHLRVVANVPRAHFTGGVELSLLGTLRDLSSRGHEVHVLYGEGGDLLADYHQFCASVGHIDPYDFYFPAARLDEWKQRARLFPAAAKAAWRRPDVYYMARTFAAMWAMDARKVARAPIVCHWRGTETPPARYLPRLRKGVKRFISNSEFTRQVWLAYGIDPERAEVVHTGIDPEAYRFGGQHERESARGQLGLHPDSFVAVFIGRIDPEKGVEVLLDAWRRLGAGPDEAQLLLVGEPVLTGDKDSYLAKLRAMAPPGSVRFVAARRDVITPLHAADVAVVPSVWDEPFGRTVIEGLSTGRPVIASRVGGIPEILAGPLERFLFERHDAEELAGRLRSVMGWQQREPELAALCRARVIESFTLERMTEGVEANLVRAVG